MVLASGFGTIILIRPGQDVIPPGGEFESPLGVNSAPGAGVEACTLAVPCQKRKTDYHYNTLLFLISAYPV